MRAVGKNCQLYITDVGCIVRRFALLQVNGWSKIPRNKVETLILRVREKFKLNTKPHVDVAIEEDMKQMYTRWRYTLHQMFIECQTVDQALSNPHVEVDVDDWKYLVELWQDESWKRNPETGVLPSRINTLKSSLDMMKKIRNGLMMMLKRLT
ncbi:hypothetical protein Dsin_003715 [Dipteronia sinensis]|uniref:Uncharacterized protein n=1 Tax=Dipteronia sinensis TaxID=43782 RepID=A0AAE0EKX4_9ROSI|nr:hypothetical protein Dsin_003715 [Dipteronia sinensis]